MIPGRARSFPPSGEVSFPLRVSRLEIVLPSLFMEFCFLLKYPSIACESINDYPSILVDEVLSSGEASFSLRVSRLVVIFPSLWMEFRLLVKHPFHCV